MPIVYQAEVTGLHEGGPSRFLLGFMTRNDAKPAAERTLRKHLGAAAVPCRWVNTLNVPEDYPNGLKARMTWIGVDSLGVPVCYLRLLMGFTEGK